MSGRFADDASLNTEFGEAIPVVTRELTKEGVYVGAAPRLRVSGTIHAT